MALLSQLALWRPDVQCHVFSRGPVFDQLRRAAGGEALVQFHDLVDDEELAGMYEHSAVQIVAEEPGASLGSLPSKLANILWMGVPVFCITDPGSELAAMVDRSGIGQVDGSFRLENQLLALCGLLDRSSSWDREASKQMVRALVGPLFSFERIRLALRA